MNSIQYVVSNRFFKALQVAAALLAASSAAAGTLTFTPASQSDIHYAGAIHTYTTQLCASGEAAQSGSVTLTLVRTGAPTFPAVFGWDANANGVLDTSEIIASGNTLPTSLAADTCATVLVRVNGTGVGTVGDVTLNTLTATHATLAASGVSALVQTVLGNARPVISVVIESGAGASTVRSFPFNVSEIDCPTKCAHEFLEGITKLFIATPAADRSFMGWTGCDSVTNGVCSVYTDRSKTIRATFADAPRMHDDFNLDRRSDLLFYNGSVLYGAQTNGSPIGTTGSIVSRLSPDWRVASVADLNGDGMADLVWHQASTGNVVAIPLYGLSPQPEVTVYSEPNPSWKLLGAADFNGDGKADLLWRNSDTGDVFLLLMNGTSVAGGGVIYSEPNTNWRIEKIADFNGDRRADILWRNTTSGELFMMTMNGTTITGGSLFYTEPDATWRIEATGDYNGDGRADIAWRRHPNGHIFIMHMNGPAILQGSLVYQVAGGYSMIGR